MKGRNGLPFRPSVRRPGIFPGDGDQRIGAGSG